MKNFKIIKPDDFHIHLREGDMLNFTVREAEKIFKKILVMPNLTPAITNSSLLENYKKNIKNISSKIEPLMTFQIDENSQIEELKKAGAVAGKLYPKGVTTNSESGVGQINLLYPIFDEMQKNEMVLSIHGEDFNRTIFDREKNFIPTIEKISKKFPKLKIVMEHISTKESVDFILNSHKNISATVTPHHLLWTNNDMLASGFDPHLYCKPILQFAKDMESIQKAVLSGNEKFFFGSDSAPHLKADKEKRFCAAGIFSTPVTISLLVCFFNDNNKISLMENFVSKNGARFYGLDINNESIDIVKKEWIVSEVMEGIVPLCAGKKMDYMVVGE